jgi:hypothetical protein
MICPRAEGKTPQHMMDDRELAGTACRSCVDACESLLEAGVGELELRNALILSAAVCSLLVDQLDDDDAPVRALVELAAETCAECARLAESESEECADACRTAVAALRLLVGAPT